MNEIEFVPWSVPLDRRIQTASVALWMAMLPGSLILFLILLTWNQATFIFSLAYLIFLHLDPAAEMGGRKSMWVREWTLWKIMASYFPVSLEKSTDLDPDTNYVFGFHPHGIISVSAFLNFGTEANSFSRLFPGVNLKLLTLEQNFNIPILRDLLLSLGMSAVSRRSCDNILHGGPGNSVMIVIGGAAEVPHAHPGKNTLVLNKRLGFVKLALRNGAPLVPVFSFGENNLWNQVDNPTGSNLRRFQDFVRKITMQTPPMLYGRGIFTYNFGILPYRSPIVTVVGRPIQVPKIIDPTHEQIKHFHTLYVQELQNLYDQHKEKYLPNRKQELIIE